MRARRDEAEDMLVVHKAKAADPRKTGRETGASAPAARRVPALDKQEFELLKKRALDAKDPSEKRSLISEAQVRFGNEKAAALVKAMRKEEEKQGDPPRTSSPKPPQGGRRGPA